MTDIHIRHCRIQARASPGSGLGWAGAEAGRAFAARVQALVLSMLDQMLAPYLAELPAAAIPDALVLDLKLDATDMMGAAPLARQHLRDRVRYAIATAMARVPKAEVARRAGESETAAETGRDAGQDAAAAQPRPVIAVSVSLLELVLGWHTDRQLEYRLALLSDAALVMLIESIVAELSGRQATSSGSVRENTGVSEGPGAPVPGAGMTSRRLRRALHRLVAAAADIADHEAASNAVARLALAIATAVDAVREVRQGLARRDLGTSEPRALEAVPGTPVSAAPDARPAELVDEAALREAIPERIAEPRKRARGASRKRATSASEARRRVERVPLPEGRYQIESALPFLALQRLSRHGILATMSALDDHGGSAALAFAVALRTQGLPGGTGWSAAQSRDAACLAGLAEPLDGAGLLAAARASSGICEMAASGVAGTLIAGHRAGVPLLLMRDAGKLVIFEQEGLYPLCRLDGARIAELFEGIDESFFVAEPDTGLLGAIDAAGLEGAAPGAPARGEGWRRAAARGWRGMTNMAPERFAAVAPRLAGTEHAARRAAEVWRGLTAERPLLAETAATADALDFDRTASLLAGFALADIGWTLFGRNPAAWVEPDPLLAVERFADLSATLDIAPGHITVSLPLGSRFTDLRDAGLLDTIRDVPWWPGRTISYSCG